MTSAALENFGRIDAVFANAGFGASRGFLEESVEHWRSMILTNVFGVALTIRATLPHLLERGDGHFLITSSVAGRRALPGSLYSATKWAATAMGESLRAELRTMHENTAIKVTLIEPGMVDTPFFDNRPGDRALSDDGHRPGGDLRTRAAGGGRRQRDPDPADAAADLINRCGAAPHQPPVGAQRRLRAGALRTIGWMKGESRSGVSQRANSAAPIALPPGSPGARAAAAASSRPGRRRSPAWRRPTLPRRRPGSGPARSAPARAPSRASSGVG